MWAGLSLGDIHNAYWEHEGGSLAVLAVSIALAVIDRREEIFAGLDLGSPILALPERTRYALNEFAEGAGIVPCPRELANALDRALEETASERSDAAETARASERDTVEAVLDEGAASIRETLAQRLGGSIDGELEDALQVCLERGRETLRGRLDRRRQQAPSREEPPLDPNGWRRLLEAVKGTDVYTSDAGFRGRLEALDETLSAATETIELREAADRILQCACSALDDAEVRPAPNVMALAQRALDLFFTPAPCGDDASDDAGYGGGVAFDRVGRRRVAQTRTVLPASRLADALRLVCGPEFEPIRQDVRRWETLAGCGDETETSPHYVGILAFAQQAFRDFSAPGPAWTLYFGIEPDWKRLVGEDYTGIVDFAAAVNADDGCTVYVVQPQLGDDKETIIAKAMKAAFFEAVLGNRDRAAGKPKPLIGYVADEFHRFVTAGDGHGEQSFLDTCRSFGACCVLASQSIASIEYALAGMGGHPDQNESAVSILLNNVGTKIFFRTTDEGTMRRIRPLCPSQPGFPTAVDVRPPSTLAPGQCYAALPDERRTDRER